LAQFLPLDVLHRHVHQVPALADVVDDDDVGVVEAPGGLRLGVEARLVLGHALVAGLLGVDGLDRDHAIEHGVVGAIYDTHRPLAQLGDDLVAAQQPGFGHDAAIVLRSLPSGTRVPTPDDPLRSRADRTRDRARAPS